MANQNFSEVRSDTKPTQRIDKSTKRATPSPFVERTAGCGGLPGKSQPGDRSAGTKRAKIHPKSSGL